MPIEAERGAGEFEVDGFAVLVGFEGGVELAAGEDGGVGDADAFDFLEVEQTRAVGQGVQRLDAQHAGRGRPVTGRAIMGSLPASVRGLRFAGWRRRIDGGPGGVGDARAWRPGGGANRADAGASTDRRGR